MMMALSAGKTEAEEHLRRSVHKLFRILQFLVPHCGRIRHFVARSAKDGASEFVIGHVARDGSVNPAVECEGATRPTGLAAPLDAQDVRPFVGEVVAVLLR